MTADQYTLTVSSELMDNYEQSEVISPQKTFEAVQTEDGLALLFSIGTDGVFYLVEQRAGAFGSWNRTDLSSGLAAVHGGRTIEAKTFAVAQHADTRTIDLALVVTVAGEDHLYLSLGRSDAAGAITPSTVAWLAVPYDDPRHPGIVLDVADVFVSHSRTEEFIVVDISESTFEKPTGYLARYRITPGADRRWNPMAIGGELEPGASSCLGRAGGERVDGIYTLGTIGRTTELLYAPLYNPFDPQAPVTIRRLTMPSGASALAVSMAGSGATDLFVAAAGGLYYFAAGNQKDGATGVRVVPDALFDGATTLYAVAYAGQVTVWGLNGRTDQAFYVTCPATELSRPGAWSVPLPILRDTEQIAPFVNRGNSANTFFAHTGAGVLTLCVKSPGTSIWALQQVSLPPADPRAKATRNRTYTTHIQVLDGNDQPAGKVPVDISSDSVTSVYINHLHRLIGPRPVQVSTDALGTITVINAVSSLSGAQFHVSLADGTSAGVNPMHDAATKATALQTADALDAAVITYQDGTVKKLVKPGVDGQTLKAVAKANAQLAAAYKDNAGGTTRRAKLRPTAGVAQLRAASAGSGDVWVEAGDLFRWLERELDSVGQAQWDDTINAWIFAIEIADRVYKTVLDDIESVLAALQTVYNAVLAEIEDLIDFVKYLFELDDIKRTKEVLANVTQLVLQHQVDQIEVIKAEFDGAIRSVEKAVNDWAGRGKPPDLGRDGTTPVNGSAKPGGNTSAPGTLLSYHYQHNVRNATMTSAPPAPPEPGTPMQVLIDALVSEWAILGTAFDDIGALADRVGTMSPADFVRQLIAVVTDTTLESVRTVVDALLDIFHDLAEDAVRAFATPIHIPVVSDILEEYGIPEFSFLDVACWVGAVPLTIAAKAAEGSAPFADDAETRTLTQATSLRQLGTLFPGSPQVTLRRSASAAVAGRRAAGDGPLASISESVAARFFQNAHAAAGTSGVLSAVFDSLDAGQKSGTNPFAIPAVISAAVGGALQVSANVLVPRHPLTDQFFVDISYGTTTLRALGKAIFSGPGQSFVAGSKQLGFLKVADARGCGSVVDAVLVFPALVCSLWHYYELSQVDAGQTRTQAILDETSNIAAYLGRISYAVAVNTEGQVKAAAIAALALSDLAYGGLQYAEAYV